ncbi:MAG: LPS export ABC transporter periplasmic protein LptC [Candidatus Obscuribacterales bacterium]|nr:LPS export ABC transporter periplasmic protein LptC [Candidatus Obscuribacterales bacterium]
MSEAVASFIHSSYFKNAIKFVVAISIPAFLIWAFKTAEKNAEEAVKATQQQLNDNPIQEGTATTNFELKELDDNMVTKWLLTAEKGHANKNQKDYILDKVKMKYFDQGNVKMAITAPKGQANMDTKWVKMESDSTGRVKAEGEGGKSKFEATTVVLEKKNQFLATGGVIIEWSEVAKVTGNSATGTVDKSGVKDVIVRGLPGHPTHAVITCK